ncbi:MAG: hypothetical protein ACE5DS_10865 [Kiloniellaceae bacterium]
MSLTVHRVNRYTVQVLTKRVGKDAHSMISVRLYDDENVCRGVAVFESYGAAEPPKPTGDYGAQSAIAYLDIAHYPAYMDILRLERTVYLKMSWAQQGKSMSLSQMSIDTKKEFIGEYFKLPRGSGGA